MRALRPCLGVVLVLGHAPAVLAAPSSHAGPWVDDVWRFTAVTERLIRIEYDADRQFVDDPTVAFLRGPPKGVWLSSHTDGDGWSVLNTTEVSVRYLRERPPEPGSVLVTSRNNTAYKWTWGDDPANGNLMGTARTLDGNAETLDLNCHNKVSPTMDNSQLHCTWGLVSKTGAAMVNETGSPVMQNGWYAPSRNTADVYVFLHGLDFTGALLDFFHAAGPPALPPRYAFGTMFTRWFNFDSDSVMSLVEEFQQRSMPLDAWIFDMNWHIYGPWGAFSWNRNSYPQLDDLLSWLQGKGLHVGANMHEDDGIRTNEDTYLQVCEALGRAPGADIPFDLYNKSYALAQEDIAVGALDTKDGKQGIDFYWIDFQQGENDAFQNITIPNLNPTIVLNNLRFTDAERRGENKRPMILSRWGGLGNHRYPLGFSGDQLHDWTGLAFLPYFTSTAANVAYNYWSHDTVGGDGDSANDFELSVRWVQTSAWSPVLRFHDKGAGTGDCASTNTCARVVPWDVPNAFFTAIREAAWEREALVPYMYTAAWASASNGHALVRPMYYEDPTDPSMYGLDHQYLFGPDMIISPITQPSGPEAKGFEQALGAVHWSLAAPASARGWVDRLNGDFYSGGSSAAVYGIRDVPGLLRQGAVIPRRPRGGPGESSLARAPLPQSALEFRIAPALAFYTGGSIAGSAQVMDDDGVTMDYTRGAFALTTCNYSFDGRAFSFHVQQVGDFTGRPSRVTLQFSFPQLPPISLHAHERLRLSAEASYSHDILGTVLTFQDVDLTKGLSFTAEIDQEYGSGLLPNFVGVLGRIRRARYIKDALDALNIPYGWDRANLTSYVLAATQMTPGFAGGLPTLWASAVAQINTILVNSKSLQQDARRYKFVSQMILGEFAPDTIGSQILMM